MIWTTKCNMPLFDLAFAGWFFCARAWASGILSSLGPSLSMASTKSLWDAVSPCNFWSTCGGWREIEQGTSSSSLEGGMGRQNGRCHWKHFGVRYTSGRKVPGPPSLCWYMLFMIIFGHIWQIVTRTTSYINVLIQSGSNKNKKATVFPLMLILDWLFFIFNFFNRFLKSINMHF